VQTSFQKVDALSVFVHFKVVICNQLADFGMVPGCGREIASY
jgi:hypothetical protein